MFCFRCDKFLTNMWKVLQHSKVVCFLLVIFYFGNVTGAMEAFLLLYLKDLGAPAILFGFMLVTSCSFEVRSILIYCDWLFMYLVASWCLIIAPTGINIKGKSTLVFMHSGIVNGYQLLCDVHTVLKPHRGTEAFFLFYSLSSFSTFSFYVFVTLDSPFLGCLYSLC